MQKDPYLVLGIDRNAGEKQIRAAYDKLRKEYSEKLFAEGEEGMEASKKLSELDVALTDCLENLQKESAVKDFGTEFGNVEKLIKEGNLDKAQSALDDIESRNAEWHYYQAMIYYRKNWYLDSKKQLQIAIAMDGTNPKYKASLDKLEAKMNGAQQQQAEAQRAGYQQQQYTQQDNANACCNSCATLCCLDSCCECMGGDLCPCC